MLRHFSFLLLFACLALRAEDPGAVFDSANKLYEQGKYGDAAAAYEKLLQSGHSSAGLCFNLGNAYFKAGQIGRAIAAYRRAQELSPRDPDIRANLQFARNQIQGPTAPVSRWTQWSNKLSLDEWTCAAAATLWVFLGVLALLQWRPALRSPMRVYVIVLGVAVLCCGVCVGVVWHERSDAKTAIVVSRDVNVRLGPFDESQPAFAVHDGAEMRVLDQKNEWLQVTIGPGRIGWVRRDQVVVSSAI